MTEVNDKRLEYRRKRRKRKKRRRFIAIFLLLILAIGGYSVYQWYQAKSTAEEKQPKEEFEFHGAEETADNFNVLMMGDDSRGDEPARTDTIMIAHYDSSSKRPKIVSIMRDTYVEIPGHGYNKINAAYAIGGPDLLRETISHNFGVDLHYYAIVGFEGFVDVVNTIAPDGIEATVTPEMTQDKKALGIQLEEGTQKLNGEELLAYARFRHDEKSDFGRVQRQQEVIQKLTDKVKSVSTVTKLPELVGFAQGYIDTNVRTGLITSMAKDVVLGKTKEFETLRIPEDGSYEDVRYEGVGLALSIDVEHNAALMQDFLHDE
ncbi:LCP family protein [Sediminibacillus halophilus]|uniref:Regulatory protein MsrR n=1 Tax=Sediminibacillus halophilus TaxID=482461 RepID=A0A1G9V9Z4_9BACI|nr:LCP family protein [Sediminibacillus halophilus]SDM69038.1 cell envelope-related function transcriptional attenuator common domain-containing protein [Sediminibacillus halophilus]